MSLYIVEDKTMKTIKVSEADYIIWSCNRHLAKALYGRKFKDLDKACLQYESEKFCQELNRRLKIIEESKKIE